MGKRQISFDDFTNAEIMSTVFSLKLTLELTGKDDETGELVTLTASPDEFDVTQTLGEAFYALVANADLASFIGRTRGMVKVTSAETDSATIRKWAKNHTPPITVNERGQIPADVLAQYKREIADRAAAADSNAATHNAALDAKRAEAEKANNESGRANGSDSAGK